MSDLSNIPHYEYDPSDDGVNYPLIISELLDKSIVNNKLLSNEDYISLIYLLSNKVKYGAPLPDYILNDYSEELRGCSNYNELYKQLYTDDPELFSNILYDSATMIDNDYIKLWSYSLAKLKGIRRS